MYGQSALRKAGLMLIEMLLLIQAGITAATISLGRLPKIKTELNGILLSLVLVAVTFQVCLYFLDLYQFDKMRALKEFPKRFCTAMLLASIVLWILNYFFPGIRAGDGVFRINLVSSAAVLTAWHTLLRLYFAGRKPRSNMIVLGTGQLACNLVREVESRPALGIKFHGFVDNSPGVLGASKIVGAQEDLAGIVKNWSIDRIVVELQDRRGCLPMDELLNLKAHGIRIEDAAALYERVTGKIAIDQLKPSWLVFNSGWGLSKRQMAFKQVAEFVFSLALLAVCSPILLLAALLIKLDSAGPVFFKQDRVGQDGRVFTLWKFRSMFRDAETATGPVWARKGDRRITRVGRILRRTRIDELPQLFNVLRGEMSLVGPRPERPCFVGELQSQIPYYNLRHSVKPGLTGWAQVKNGYANSVEGAAEKLRYDLFYVKNLSFRLDALITLETVKTCLCLRGV